MLRKYYTVTTQLWLNILITLFKKNNWLTLNVTGRKQNNNRLLRTLICRECFCEASHFAQGGVTFNSLLVTRWNSLVVKSLVTRCKIRSLLVAEDAPCNKALVTRCRSCSLQKITRYSLQNLLLTCCRSSSLQNSLVTRCRSYSLKQSHVNKVSWKF